MWACPTGPPPSSRPSTAGRLRGRWYRAGRLVAGAPVPVTVEVDGDDAAFLCALLAARTAIADTYRELLRDPLP
jgi:hypothetical protein